MICCRYLQVSGLSKVIGNQLFALHVLPGWIMVMMIVIFVAMLTEVTSNTAVVTIVCPILANMVGPHQILVLLHDVNGERKKTRSTRRQVP